MKLNSQWEELSGPPRLRRHWSFSNFKKPWNLVQKIAAHAEQVNHHPEISFGWGYLTIVLTTHSANGLTPADFEFAQVIDKLGEDEKT